MAIKAYQMRIEKKHTKTIFQFQSDYQPEQIWEYLTHPKYAVGFSLEPCYNNEISESFKLEKNNKWKEIHTGEDCTGDVVVCKITDVYKYNLFTTVRHQAGIKNTTIFKLEKNEKGTIITETQKFTLSIKKMKPINIFAWLMLVTGLLTKFSFKPEEDEYWFKKMEEHIKEIH